MKIKLKKKKKLYKNKKKFSKSTKMNWLNKKKSFEIIKIKPKEI